MIFDEYGKNKDKRPTWFNMPGFDILEWLDVLDEEVEIDDLLQDMANDDEAFFEDMGRLFVNSLAYFWNRDNSPVFQMKKDYNLLYRRIKSAIDHSYRNYYIKVENGGKGGRPPKKEKDNDIFGGYK